MRSAEENTLRTIPLPAMNRLRLGWMLAIVLMAAAPAFAHPVPFSYLDLRLSAELKTLLARAASYCGMSLSSFLVSSAAQRAKEVVAGHETLTLTNRLLTR